MKLKKILIFVLALFAFVPINALAANKSCDQYTVDKCPANNCQVKDGVCVKAHIAEDFCSQEHVMNAARVTGYFVLVMRVAIPFIVIFMGSIDLYKAVLGGDEKSLSASVKKFGIRFFIGFLAFLFPTILHIILSGLHDYEAISDDANICLTCVLKPTSCVDGLPADTNPFDDDLFNTSES